MKIKYNAIAKIELHDLTGVQDFSEIMKHPTNKIKIDGKDYYIAETNINFQSNSVDFIEIQPSEHEIEIGENLFSEPLRCEEV